MKITETTLPGVLILEPTVFKDNRGIFARLFNVDELDHIIGERYIHQVNLSLTNVPGTVRGIHYQYAPYAEMKLVRCLQGRALNVALDLRQGSQTLLQYITVELSSDNNLMLVTPEGCAHGFQAIEPDTKLLYLHTALYNPEFEDGVSCTDPAIGIDWPLPVTNLSSRDNSFSPLPEDFSGIQV